MAGGYPPESRQYAMPSDAVRLIMIFLSSTSANLPLARTHVLQFRWVCTNFSEHTPFKCRSQAGGVQWPLFG
jgi:hypothetical protein